MSRLKVRDVVKMPVEMQAADVLRDSIINGSIPPGARITEIQLSDQLKLSRATIRTALHQLAAEELIVLVPYTGWTVTSLSAHDAWELYTLRSSVERLAAELAAVAENRKPILSAAYDALVAACASNDPNAIADADFGLHKAIIDLTGHKRLARQYALIEQQIRMYIHSSDALIPEPEQILDQHRPIVEAILQGRAEEAGRLSELHNIEEGEKLTIFLKQGQASPRSSGDRV